MSVHTNEVKEFVVKYDARRDAFYVLVPIHNPSAPMTYRGAPAFANPAAARTALDPWFATVEDAQAAARSAFPNAQQVRY